MGFESDISDATSDFRWHSLCFRWYTALYLLLLFATLVQYFITSSSSPGYVVDVMRAVNETNVIYQKSSMASK
ncbi:hypothetical protein Godav_020443 [Gossypium davidsonii]|uniref:Uncharacterized protein n=1 Tax=Gossypium davidsonii TaxID=34287 RepID=A0A7J8R352_GOSDV|nr:hypothetical protein [Gossypium davidsonii]